MYLNADDLFSMQGRSMHFRRKIVSVVDVSFKVCQYNTLMGRQCDTLLTAALL